MVDTQKFNALCNRLTEFANRDAIPIATVVAQASIQENTQRKPVEKPSVKKGWKLNQKKPLEPKPVVSATQPIAGDALADAIKDKLQQYLNHSIKQWI